MAEGWRPWVEGRDADRDASARNLLQYLALRGRDLSDLQDPLIALGLSSSGRQRGSRPGQRGRRAATRSTRSPIRPAVVEFAAARADRICPQP